MLADPPATGSTSSASSTSRKLRRADYPRLLLGRAGGLPAPLTPSRLQVMASLGCCRLPDALAGSLDQFAAPLFSAVFNRAGTVVAAACQDTTISLFDTDQLLYRQSAAAAAQASKSAGRAGAASSSSRLAAPPLPPLRPRKEIQCQVCPYVWSLRSRTGVFTNGIIE